MNTCNTNKYFAYGPTLLLSSDTRHNKSLVNLLLEIHAPLNLIRKSFSYGGGVDSIAIRRVEYSRPRLNCCVLTDLVYLYSMFRVEVVVAENAVYAVDCTGSMYMCGL